jgi:hypothetical protein|tara:strand:+ start:85 stop:441 length:357 start_codon:yes stop_codon:yes gene_type:complete
MIAKKGKTKYNKSMKVKKTKKLIAKKKSSKKSEEPWVKVLDMNVNPDNPRNGFFELDWNDEFVNMLKQNGYLGQTDEEIVDRWFQTLCRTIGNEQGIDSINSGYVQINRTVDGKTEIS